MHHRHVRETDWEEIGNFSPFVYPLLLLFFSSSSSSPPPPLQSVKVGCLRVMEVVQRQQRKQSRWALQLWENRGEGNQPGWCDDWHSTLDPYSKYFLCAPHTDLHQSLPTFLNLIFLSLPFHV